MQEARRNCWEQILGTHVLQTAAMLLKNAVLVRVVLLLTAAAAAAAIALLLLFRYHQYHDPSYFCVPLDKRQTADSRDQRPFVPL